MAKLIPLEEVENFFWNKALKSRGDDTVMYINLKDEILKLHTIDPIEEIDKMIEWIPVTEKLPEKDGSFFLCVHKGNPQYIISGYWGTYHPNAKGDNCWRNARREKIIFTHWKPLPLPPNN